VSAKAGGLERPPGETLWIQDRYRPMTRRRWVLRMSRVACLSVNTIIIFVSSRAWSSVISL
jgi:uncharacterized membrane protein